MFAYRSLLKVALFLVTYGATRGLAFIGALLLPRLLTAELYGGLELALSIAVLAGCVAGVGVPHATPYMKLVGGREGLIDLLALAFLLSAAPLLVGSMIAWCYGGAWTAGVALALALSGAYSAQYGLCFWARAGGRRFWSIWVDNGILVLLGSSAILLTLLQRVPNATELIGALWGGNLALIVGAAVILGYYRRPGLWNDWRQAFKIGFPLLGTALILLTFTATPRLLAGRFLPLADVGALALAARICLPLIALYQILLTWNFRNFYSWPQKRCDQVFSWLLVGLASLGGGIILIWPWIVHLVAPDFPPIPRLIAALVVGQTILWITLAFLESLIGRQNLGLKAVPALALIGLAGWAAIEVLMRLYPITPQGIVLAGMGLMAAAGGTQWFLLRQSGFTLPRVAGSLLFVALASLVALSVEL